MLLQLHQLYPSHQRAQRRADLVCGLLRHACPYLVLLRTAHIAEHQICQKHKQTENQHLNQREIAHLQQQIRPSVINVSLIVVKIINLDRIVLFLHRTNLILNVFRVFHLDGVEVSVCQNGVVDAVHDDDRRTDGIVGHIVDEKFEQIIQNTFQLSVNQRFFVKKPLCLSEKVDLYRLINAEFHHHLFVELRLVFKMFRQVDGKVYLCGIVSNHYRNADVALYDVKIYRGVFLRTCLKKALVRLRQQLHAFLLLLAHLVEEDFGVIHQLSMALHRLCPHLNLLRLLRRKTLHQTARILYRNAYYDDRQHRERQIPPSLLNVNVSFHSTKIQKF